MDRQIGKAQALYRPDKPSGGAGESPDGAPAAAGDEAARQAAQVDDGQTEDDEHGTEEKRVTWCHRMKSTRDHTEIPELMEVLGLDGQGQPIKDKKRWTRALEMRKGTGAQHGLADERADGKGGRHLGDGRHVGRGRPTGRR